MKASISVFLVFTLLILTQVSCEDGNKEPQLSELCIHVIDKATKEPIASATIGYFLNSLISSQTDIYQRMITDENGMACIEYNETNQTISSLEVSKGGYMKESLNNYQYKTSISVELMRAALLTIKVKVSEAIPNDDYYLDISSPGIDNITIYAPADTSITKSVYPGASYVLWQWRTYYGDIYESKQVQIFLVSDERTTVEIP